LEREAYLSNHVFFSRLKGKEIDLRGFQERLVALTNGVLADIRREVPAEWLREDLERIETHLVEIREHRGEFIEQVRRRLA
jgi:hypothetical protein